MQFAPMVGEVKGELLYEEQLYEAYLPGGRITPTKLLLGAYGLRAAGLLSIVILIAEIYTHQLPTITPFYLMVDIVAVFGILLILWYGEYVYINGGLSSRPLRLYTNGLEIPPLYHRKFIKNSGFISKERIDHIELKRHRQFGIVYSQGNGVAWRSSPVEFIVHLKNGRTRSSGKRPFEAIQYAVNEMNRLWGVRVVDNGVGNGQRIVVRNSEIAELTKL
jgi:hypothetical protein